MAAQRPAVHLLPVLAARRVALEHAAHTRPRSRARRLLALAGYALFLLACVEVALQLYYRATTGDFLFERATPPAWAPDPYSGVFNRPRLALEQGTQEFEARYYTDSAGLRVARPGLEISPEKPADAFRVLLLGPSFAFGWGVDHEATFAARLEAQLQRAGFAGGRRIEVVNAGVNSMPPAPHLEWYRHVGSRYRPDLVIQFIYASLRVPNRKQVDVRVDERGYLIQSDQSALQRARAYAKNFATVFYAWVLSTRFSSGPEVEGEPAEVLGAGRELHAATGAFDPTTPEEVEALAFYEDLATTVRENGSELLIVYFPLSYAIHPEDASRWRHLGVRDVESQMRFDAAFCAYLTQHGTRCLDVTPELRRAAESGERLYYWLDIHWTARGNAVVADAVAAHLLAALRGAASGSRGEEQDPG